MLDCRLLPVVLRPLVDKFYRHHRSAMRSRAGDACWVAQRHGDIVAALSLRQLEHGGWLSGLFVAPPQRRQGIALALVRHAQAAHGQPLWLFCHPDLQGFYQRCGFSVCDELPTQLDERLARYRRSKPLLAMRCH